MKLAKALTDGNYLNRLAHLVKLPGPQFHKMSVLMELNISNAATFYLLEVLDS